MQNKMTRYRIYENKLTNFSYIFICKKISEILLDLPEPNVKRAFAILRKNKRL